MNGASSVIGSITAVILLMKVGFAAALFTAAILYLIAFLSIAGDRRAGT